MSVRIFEPLTIRGVTIKNRVWLPPMCVYCAQDGVVDAWHAMHYGALAAGGFGLVTAEAMAVFSIPMLSNVLWVGFFPGLGWFSLVFHPS